MDSGWRVIEEGNTSGDILSGLTAFSAVLILLGLMVVVFNILLFFKLWNMTDDIRKIKVLLEDKKDIT